MAAKSSAPRFTHHPLLWLAVCFGAGISAANYFPSPFETLPGICVVSAIAAAIFINRNLSLFFLSAAFVSAGFLTFQIEKQGVAENRLRRIYDEARIESGKPIEIEGIVLGIPEPAFNGFLIKIRAEKITHEGQTQNVSGKIRLFAPVQSEQAALEYEQHDLQYGSRVRVACGPEREDRYLNPGVLSRKEQLDQQDLDATATVKSPLLIEKLGQERVFQPLAIVFNQRQNLIAEFRDKFSVSTAGVLVASLLGDKYFLDKQTADVFREGGTFHILVISGLHITFIGGLTILIVRIFTKKKWWQFLIASSFLWAYTLAVGAEVPVVRASLMFTILFFSQVIYRKSTLLNALGACALVLLVWRPQDLFTPSFQLTFVSVAAIVVMGFPLIENLRSIGRWIPTTETPFPPRVPVWLKRFCEMFYWRENVWEIESRRQIWSASLFKSPYLKWLEAKGLQGACAFVFEGILISFVVQLWLLPLLVVYFHRVSPASILLNLWVGVFIALESFSALLAVFFSSISATLALPVIKLTEGFNWLLIALPRLLVNNDWASFRLPVHSGPMRAIYLLYPLPVIVLGYIAYTWNPFAFRSETTAIALGFKMTAAAGTIAIVFGLVIVFHPFSAPKADGRLHVEFLDVGQGDAALITFPNGKTMLVDGGGRINYTNKFRDETDESDAFEPDVPRIGEAVVSEFLWEKGYSKVDYLLATHAHVDHIQGLADVAANFAVTEAYFAGMPVNDPHFAEFSKVLTRRGIPGKRIVRGEIFRIGGVEVDILFPIVNEPVSDNNHSAVLRLGFGSRKFLLTGDIERDSEQELLKSPEFVKADVVKVAHHGSRTSSTQAFVDATGAQYAIIPVGKRSMFGHPHFEVVDRWKRSGAKVMTTGERGTISVSTDGDDIKITTFVPFLRVVAN